MDIDVLYRMESYFAKPSTRRLEQLIEDSINKLRRMTNRTDMIRKEHLTFLVGTEISEDRFESFEDLFKHLARYNTHPALDVIKIFVVLTPTIEWIIDKSSDVKRTKVSEVSSIKLDTNGQYSNLLKNLYREYLGEDKLNKIEDVQASTISDNIFTEDEKIAVKPAGVSFFKTAGLGNGREFDYLAFDRMENEREQYLILSGAKMGESIQGIEVEEVSHAEVISFLKNLTTGYTELLKDLDKFTA